jgi:hypothetical protein
MKLRRDVLIAVLATFCLTSALFAVKPSGSQTSPKAQYDPWADLNDDGKISMDEIVKACELFGTTGDPAKRVIISGHETYYEVRSGTVTSPGYYYYFNTTGWDRISILIRVQGTATVYLCWWWGTQSLPPAPYAWFTVKNSDETYKYDSQVMAPLFYVYYDQADGVLNCYTAIAFYITA